MLGKSDEYVASCGLALLVEYLPLLDDLLVPSSHVVGEGGFTPGGVIVSKAPLRLDVLDVKEYAEGGVFRYAGGCAEYPGVVLPETRVGWVYARWLLINMDLVALMEWASEFVAAVGEASHRVRELVDPSESVVNAAPVDVVMDPSVDPSVGLVSARAASRVCAAAGVRVSARTICSWIKSGRVTSVEVGVDRRLVDAREVMLVARDRMCSRSSRLELL